MADGLAQAPNPPSSPQGASGATSPVPNRGMEAAGLAELGMTVRQLESVAAKFPINSEIGRAVREAALKLSKHVPAGAIAPGIEQNAAAAMMQKLRQVAPMIAQMRNGGGSPPAAQGAPPGAGQNPAAAAA